jgi:hypothetical protein
VWVGWNGRHGVVSAYWVAAEAAMFHVEHNIFRLWRCGVAAAVRVFLSMIYG